MLQVAHTQPRVLPIMVFDMEHLQEYSAAAKSFENYSNKYLNLSHQEYVEVIGGQNFINAIPLPQF